jgi:hypothetical protein
VPPGRIRQGVQVPINRAEAAGFEPAISALTGLHVRPLHHASAATVPPLCPHVLARSTAPRSGPKRTCQAWCHWLRGGPLPGRPSAAEPSTASGHEQLDANRSGHPAAFTALRTPRPVPRGRVSRWASSPTSASTSSPGSSRRPTAHRRAALTHKVARRRHHHRCSPSNAPRPDGSRPVHPPPRSVPVSLGTTVHERQWHFCQVSPENPIRIRSRRRRPARHEGQRSAFPYPASNADGYMKSDADDNTGATGNLASLSERPSRDPRQREPCGVVGSGSVPVNGYSTDWVLIILAVVRVTKFLPVTIL